MIGCQTFGSFHTPSLSLFSQGRTSKIGRDLQVYHVGHYMIDLLEKPTSFTSTYSRLHPITVGLSLWNISRVYKENCIATLFPILQKIVSYNEDLLWCVLWVGK